MSKIDLSILKTKFETGDIPTGSDFVDLIDTLNDTTVNADIVPVNNSVLNIGSATHRFKTIYVDEAKLSTNTLYLGDTPVLGTNQSTVEVKADLDQSITIKTTGTGQSKIISQNGVELSTSGQNADVKVQAIGTGSRAVLGAAGSIDLTAPTTNISGALVVTGDATFNGTNTIVNTSTIEAKDNVILLNRGQVGSGVSSGVAGIRIDRGDLADAQIIFDETTDQWKFGILGSESVLLTSTDVSNKADKATTLSGYNISDAYTKAQVDSAVSVKADASSVYTKAEVDTSLSAKANASTTYSKTETDSRIQAVVGSAPAALDTLQEIAAQLASDESAAAALTTTVSNKANKATTISGYGITDAYTKTEVDTKVTSAVSGKANSATTISGYGITDAYTKTEVDSKVSSGGSSVTYSANAPSSPTVGTLWIAP